MGSAASGKYTKLSFPMGIACNFVVFWIMCVPGIVIGTVSITFEPSKPPLPDALVISCKLTDSSSDGITWKVGNITTTCGLGICSPNPSPHTYNMSANVFNLMLSPVAIENCLSYSCQDANDATDITSNDLYVAYFDKNEIVATEPGANTDGSISVITGCVLSPHDLTVKWYKIENGKERDYNVDSLNTARSTCIQTCHSEEDKKVTSGFTHTEYTGSDFVEVEYKVTISHSSYTDPFNWTSAKYRLKAPIPPGPDCWCWCWWGCHYDLNKAVGVLMCMICWIVFVLLIATILYIVGTIIGSILTKTRCCCRGFYHCKDSDCECCQGCVKSKYVTCACCASLPCGVCCNIAGLPFWVQVLWGTIIGAPVALGNYTVWKCFGRGNGNVDAKCEDPKFETQSGNTRTGQKKSEIKNKSKISARTENEQGRKSREQPPIPLVAQTTETTMSGREDSDSAVSREHVKLQDSDRTLPLRPMPDIPRKSDRQGHDSKGRGLSANFSDDDHPLVSIDIPLQKKGALDALPEGTGGEEPVKKKKKKKKKQEEDEE